MEPTSATTPASQAEQRGATPAPTPTPARQAATSPLRGRRLQVLFGMREVCELTGIRVKTLRTWMKDGAITPAFKSWGGKGRETQFSGWQTVALALIGGAFRDARDRYQYLGVTAVRTQVSALAELDDAELLSENLQDPYTAEGGAALASASVLDVEMSEETAERLAEVLSRLDAKVRARRSRMR